MLESFDTPVRCSAGHLYHDDLGAARDAQGRAARPGALRALPGRASLGKVTRLEDDPATTEEELKEAALVHDVRIP